MQIQLQFTIFNFSKFSHTHKANSAPKLDSGVILNEILDVLENRTLISKVQNSQLLTSPSLKWEKTF